MSGGGREGRAPLDGRRVVVSVRLRRLMCPVRLSAADVL
ncbi:hypothetical protein SBD_1633 [Streptomyces bottropensis ATCC 25435]|uniref:Uncharacterized protein n=1 Tax=Streptomyces bottropensis ATCC 25435 TaxID=1054862 RepID=M3DJT4_9ACTN|nr:hypothetical protein SBD_1633 [Streptomyces bottropensis ATCC 25435]